MRLRYKILTSARCFDDLSIDFNRDRKRSQREFTNIKTLKGEFHLRIYLGDVFAFAEYQEKGTYGIGYKVILTKNTDNAVLNKGNAINNGKIKINAKEWFVPHYTPSITQQNITMYQNIKKMSRDLQYPERSVFMKEIILQTFWSFELGTKEGINIPIWIFVVFRQSDREDDQNLNNDIFY